MSITTEEAAQIARAYKLSLTDAETLIRLVGPAGTYEDAVHLAVDFAGSNEERAGQAHTDARKQRDAEQAAEHEKLEKYMAAHPKPKKPERVQVQPDLRDGMSDGERVREMNKAHEANVRAEAKDRADAAQQSSLDYYAWAAAGKPEK